MAQLEALEEDNRKSLDSLASQHKLDIENLQTEYMKILDE